MEIPEGSRKIRIKYPQDNIGLEILETAAKLQNLDLGDSQEFADTLEAQGGAGTSNAVMNKVFPEKPHSSGGIILRRSQELTAFLCSSLVKPVSKADMLESMSMVSCPPKPYKIIKYKDRSAGRKKLSKNLKTMFRKKIEIKDDHAAKSNLWAPDIGGDDKEPTKKIGTTGRWPATRDLDSFSKIISPCYRHAISCSFKSRGTAWKSLYIDKRVNVVRVAFKNNEIVIVDPPFWVLQKKEKAYHNIYHQLGQLDLMCKGLVIQTDADIERWSKKLDIKVNRRTAVVYKYLSKLKKNFGNGNSRKKCLAVGPYVKEEPKVEVGNEEKDPKEVRDEEKDPEEVRNKGKDPEEVEA